jgi:hypothetical protein
MATFKELTAEWACITNNGNSHCSFAGQNIINILLH